MEKTAALKQIILVTDGHSNRGESPVEVAREASSQGITVNALGLLHQGELGELGRKEIEAIAQAGEGVWDIVQAEELAQSLQMISQQSSVQTMEKLVNKQLKKVLGVESIVDIPPEKRGKVLQMLEEIGEKSYLRCVILLDCSGSMASKLELAKDSIVDLLLSLQARAGGGEIALIAFPGGRDSLAKVVSDFTQQVDALETALNSLKVRGGTPTGPALREALSLFQSCLKTPIQEESLVV